MSKSRKSSPLATYKRLSPNCSKPRNGPVKRLTPHCVAGNLSAEGILNLSAFTVPNSLTGASCNYAIGGTGKIALGVEETNRAWTSSSSVNDNQAITCEIANSGGAPNWPMTDKALTAWVELSIDIAKFYGFKKVMYKAKPSSVATGTAPTEAWIKTLKVPNDTMLVTLHQWYKNKACPGKYFISKLPGLVDRINKGLGSSTSSSSSTPKTASTSIPSPSKESDVNYKVKITVAALNVRKGPGVNHAVSKDSNGKSIVLRNDKNSYTIVDVKDGLGDAKSKTKIKWGKLKSGAGWVALKYTKKI